MHEIIDSSTPNLDLEIDPKLSYALRNYHFFPVDINRADLTLLKRIPGIGVKTANLIYQSRKHHPLRFADLKKMGAALNRAQHFIQIPDNPSRKKWNDPQILRQYLTKKTPQQLNLFA